MARIFLFLFLFFHFSNGFCDSKDPSVLAATEGEPLSRISNHVQALTGDFTFFEEDYVVPGIEPIPLRRLYVSGDGKADNGGWEFFPHTKLTLLPPKNIYTGGKATQRALVHEPSGSLLTFKLRGKKNHEEGTYTIDFEKHGKGITNTSQGVISARTNLKNSRLERSEGDKFHLFCPDGTDRFYTRITTEHGIHTFLLDSEILPNKNQIFYSYDDEQRLSRIKTTNPANTKTYAWVTFTYFGKPEKNHDFNINTSDGKRVEYRFKKERIGKKNYFYLVSVKTPSGPEASIEYTKEDEDIGPLFHKQILPEGRQLMATYYESGKNDVDGTEVKVGDKHDPRVGSVKVLYAPLGRDDKLWMSYRFFYSISRKKNPGGYYDYTDHGVTEIADSQGCKTLIRFTPSFLPLNIESFNEKNELHHTLVMEWEGYGELKKKTLLNGAGELIWSRELVYDEKGNVTQEIFSGDLEGKGRIETAVKKIFYTKDNLIERVEEENGAVSNFTYLPGTPLVTAKYIGDTTHILQREFFEYTSDNQLIRTISDDGCAVSSNDLSGVEQRLIKHIILKQEGPGVDFPEIIEERFWDKPSQSEKLLKKTVFFYRPDLKLERRDIYDATNTFRYSLYTKYDEKGRPCEENNPEGDITKTTYDLLGNPILIEEAGGRIKKEIRYDASNRITKTKEIGFDGQVHVTEHAYNSKHDKIATIDPYGNQTDFSPDVFGNIAATLLPKVENERPVARAVFDSDQREISSTDPRGDTTVRTYNAYGKPTKIIYPNGSTEKLLYNDDGSLREKIDTLSTKTEYRYDILGREVERIVRGPRYVHLLEETWDWGGRLLHAHTNAEGETTHLFYDGAGRKIAEQDERQRVDFGYDALGRLCLTRSSDGKNTLLTLKTFDLLGQCLEERCEDDRGTLLSKVNYTYDKAGNKTSIVREVSGQETKESFEYDAFNRLISHTDPLGHTTTFSYNEQYKNSLGQRVLQKTETAPNGLQTIQTHDALGRVVSIEKKNSLDATLALDVLHYDKGGSLSFQESSVIAPSGFQTTVMTLWEHGTMGKLVSLTEGAGTPEQKITRYTYTDTGLLHQTIKPDGVILQRTYDPLGREETLTSSDGTIAYQYAYTRLNQLSAVENLKTHKATLRSYTKGLLTTEMLETGLEVCNTHDALGRRIECLLPDESSIHFDHDALYLREISRISRSGQILYTHQFTDYDTSGNLLEQKVIHNLGTIKYTLDPLERVTELTTPFGTQKCDAFDPVGNLTHTRFNFPFNQESRTYTYNTLSQLTSENNHTFSYDSRHNRLTHDKERYTVNAISALVSTPTSIFTYDLNGNPIRKHTLEGDTTYEYDALDRLVAVNEPTIRTTFTYDGLHRRLSKTRYTQSNTGWITDEVLLFFYDDQNEIGATDTSLKIVELRILGHTPNAEIGAAIALELYGDTYLPIHDTFGNVIALYSPTGTLLESYHYTAFGEETATLRHSNPWRFSSKRTDDTHLVYYGRRYYDPSLGRWLTPDPKGYTPSTSLYAFVNNRPLTLLDLYGLEPNEGGAIGQIFDTGAEWLGRGLEMVGKGICYAFQHAVPVPGIRGMGIALGDGLAYLGAQRHIKPTERSSYIDRHGTKGPAKNHSIIITGGIMTTDDESAACAEFLSQSLGGIEVVRVYGATHGFAMDILECIAQSLGIMTHTDRLLKLALQQEIRAVGNTGSDGTVHLIAHSQGGLAARNATYDLTPEEREMVNVTTFGTACAFERNGLKNIHHFISSHDFAFGLHLLGYLSQCVNGNVTILKSRKRGWFDHAIMGPTYGIALDKLGKSLKKEIGQTQ